MFKKNEMSTKPIEPIVSKKLPSHPSLTKQKPTTDITTNYHSEASLSSKHSQKEPFIRLTSKGSTILFHAADGRLIEIPSDIASDVLDWDTTRHFTILTWGEKIILGFVQMGRTFSQQWLAHVLLLFVLLMYTALGGLMFHYVEGPHEIRLKRNLDDARVKLTRQVRLSCRNTDEADWHKNFGDAIRDYEQTVIKTPSAASREVKWDFIGSLVFSGAVYTTIGYGNVVPTTDYGRGLTMIYAFIGIPLILIVLADFGKMLTRAIKFVWSFIRRFYYTGKCKSFRSSPAVHAVHRFIPKKRVKSSFDTETPTPEYVAVKKTFIVDDNFDLPVTIAISLLLGYIVFGAWMMDWWETEWTYFQAFYFIFISLTTIGFGDMVPNNATYLALTFIYLLFGLALTSMCINVVQVAISNTVLKAKKKIAMRVRFLASQSTVHSKSAKTDSSIHQENKKKIKINLKN